MRKDVEGVLIASVYSLSLLGFEFMSGNWLR